MINLALLRLEDLISDNEAEYAAPAIIANKKTLLFVEYIIV